MENRRQHFRYALKPRSYWKAAFRSLDSTASFSAEIVNLSVGGVCVKLEPGYSAKTRRWLVTVELSTQGPPLRIPVERIHPDACEPGRCGFRFLPLPNAEDQDEQDRRIWNFVLESQRRDRREAARTAG